MDENYHASFIKLTFLIITHLFIKIIKYLLYYIDMVENFDENVMYNVLLKKITMYKRIIKRTFEALQLYSSKQMINSVDIAVLRKELDEITSTIHIVEQSLKEVNINFNTLIEQLQIVNNKLSVLIKQNGTSTLEDMLIICYGEDFININIRDDTELNKKFNLLNECSTILNYKIVSYSLQNRKGGKRKKNTILEDIHIAESSNTLDVHNISSESAGDFETKLYGFKVVVQNEQLEQTIIINCLLNNIPHNYLHSDFFSKRIQHLNEDTPTSLEYNDMYKIFVDSLSMKDLLVYSSDDIFDIYMGYLANITIIKGKLLSKITREFMSYGLYEQRSTIIQLLLDKHDHESQYIAYLLYDMLSSEQKADGDSSLQMKLYNSLPSCIQFNFKHAMKNTIEYTSKLMDIDLEGKLPLEQRVCLMKTSDSVKEKAMLKVKELRSKNEDSGSKARHYVEGLLKIPFGIYNKEYSLNVLDNIKEKIEKCDEAEKKDLNLVNHKNLDIITMCKKMSLDVNNIVNIKKLTKANVKHIIKHYKEEYKTQLPLSTKLKDGRVQLLELMEKDSEVKDRVLDIIATKESSKKFEIYNEYKQIGKYMKDVNTILDESVHGHEDAKKQIERIIGQWITGEQTGYCFGFEGPPGIGKTSLAKNGISKCLKDKDGNSRPFGFIAIGGSSNGSTLDGHNYTYVGSMWGKIVDILMESKCMNPIIFIDEIDKVSRTEAGREIIGILTHLVDPTQNDKFQDKYFSGIDLDLSKVLFIFSYNDVQLMDSILLDRIHRVKFKHLSLDEKITITKKYVLPEYTKRMGYEVHSDLFTMEDNVIKYLIDNYTAEAGVRKLKELVFEIISEINLEMLNDETLELPIKLTNDLIDNKYLKKRHPIIPKMIHEKPVCGVINGLWANALGKGGIIQIETQFILSNNMLDMKLTGLQGDVMKESMSVAKSLAWKMTSDQNKERLLKTFEATKTQGIHIHCPEGAVPKDGPSAGTAITTCLYSLLNEIPIKHDLAITGEMNLQGKVTAIGGLDLKILGGIVAGVKTFLFPKENQDAFDDFMKEWGSKDIVKGIEFHAIETIEEALSHALVKQD